MRGPVGARSSWRQLHLRHHKLRMYINRIHDDLHAVAFTDVQFAECFAIRLHRKIVLPRLTSFVFLHATIQQRHVRLLHNSPVLARVATVRSSLTSISSSHSSGARSLRIASTRANRGCNSLSSTKAIFQ
eukprot:GEMP01057081.1.p1 GENE.GEMP01057081.1~~GEMP01057081.1.p1  ORF type:complete len:130 (-),score=7.60 GEMP01057081.1:59-448(-)